MARPLVNLVVEDGLSEMVCKRLLAEHAIEIGTVYGRSGSGLLRVKLPAYNQAARNNRYLALTDLDRAECAAGLWREWFPTIERNPNLIFRVAVREVESWLLGDTSGLRRFLKLRAPIHVPNPDLIQDPKRELLAWAEKSPIRNLREALAHRDRHGQLVQGPDYNGALGGFVERSWDAKRAADASPSLGRAIAAIRRLGVHSPDSVSMESDFAKIHPD